MFLQLYDFTKQYKFILKYKSIMTIIKGLKEVIVFHNILCAWSAIYVNRQHPKGFQKRIISKQNVPEHEVQTIVIDQVHFEVQRVHSRVVD